MKSSSANDNAEALSDDLYRAAAALVTKEMILYDNVSKAERLECQWDGEQFEFSMTLPDGTSFYEKGDVSDLFFMFAGLELNTSIRCITMRDLTLYYDMVEGVCKPSLHSLRLDNCGLDDRSISDLYKLLRGSVSLERLDLNQNPITLVGARVLRCLAERTVNLIHLSFTPPPGEEAAGIIDTIAHYCAVHREEGPVEEAWEDRVVQTEEPKCSPSK